MKTEIDKKGGMYTFPETANAKMKEFAEKLKALAFEYFDDNEIKAEHVYVSMCKDKQSDQIYIEIYDWLGKDKDSKKYLEYDYISVKED